MDDEAKALAEAEWWNARRTPVQNLGEFMLHLREVREAATSAAVKGRE